MLLKWPGFNDRGSLLIDISPESFYLAKKPVEIDGERYYPKQELHVTLIGSRLGAQLQDKIWQETMSHEMAAKNHNLDIALKNVFEALDWCYDQTGRVHILSRRINGCVQKSVITLLEMPAVAAFYQQLKSLGLIVPDTPVPPAHVTLYTRNCHLGIGVPSHEILESLTVKILPLNTLPASSG